MGELIPRGELRTWNPGIPDVVDYPVRVVGVAATPLPVLGRTYVVELLGPPLPGYPYSHLTAYEVNLS